MRRFLRRLRWFAGCVAALILLWLGGLAWFVYDGRRTTDDSAAPTDAIVVLTGGRFRLESGLDLLEEGKAHKLFVSGVNQRVDRVALLRLFGPVPNWASCCIVLGHDADNTFGNARETADWMRREGYRSLRLVTSWYHMERSLLEFRRAMPDAVIVAVPVFASHAETGEHWLDVALLTVSEYDKYLATLVRPAVVKVWPGAAASYAVQHS